MKNSIKRVLIAALILCAGATTYHYATRPSLSEMVGQMVLVGFRGTGTGLYEQDLKILESEIAAGHVGGVILFNKDVTTNLGPRNILSTQQTKNLNVRLQNVATKSGNKKLFIAIDQEGGTVNRLTPDAGFKITQSAAVLGRGTIENTYSVAYDLGKRLYELGFNVDHAPDVDLATNPGNPIIAKRERAFSRDANVVTKHAAAFANGLVKSNVIFSFKHFPGHGSSKSDTHHGMVDITNTWDVDELKPYYELVKSDMMGMVMVAHVMNAKIDEKYPASLSKNTIDILRRDMKYNGVVITDDLQMGAIINEWGQDAVIELAINAGVDILLMGNNMTYDPDIASKTHATVIKLVRDGKISKSRIRESYNRIIKLKKQNGLVK